jgi:hypothetical protein
VVILIINLAIAFYKRAIIKIFIWGIIYIFIIAREIIVRGIIIKTIIKIIIAIKRKVLRKIIAIIKTISH